MHSPAYQPPDAIEFQLFFYHSPALLGAPLAAIRSKRRPVLRPGVEADDQDSDETAEGHFQSCELRLLLLDFCYKHHFPGRMKRSGMRSGVQYKNVAEGAL